MEWLRTLPLMHTDDDTGMVMIHAGIHPGWSIEKSQSLANEVEHVLQSDRHIEFYNNMYGNKPESWSDNLTGWPRMRYITNIFTRLRYCTPQGRVALGHKREPGTQPEGYLPWFSIKPRASSNTPVIFGHWSTLILNKDIEYPNVYPLDTGCLWGGKLSAMCIDKEPYEIHQINCEETALL